MSKDVSDQSNEAFKKRILKAAASISDAQIYEISSSLLKASDNLEGNTQNSPKSFWNPQKKENGTNSPKFTKVQKTQNLQKTLKHYEDQFKSFGLEIDHKTFSQDGPFYKNINERINTDQDIEMVMEMFCQYMNVLASKDQQQQMHFLESFPPKNAADIACVGGSATRLQDLLYQLSVNNEKRMFGDAHSITISQLIEKVATHTGGDHVHTNPYLQYAIGLDSADNLIQKDNTFRGPQFSIPSPLLFNISSNYNDIYRKNLVSQMKDKIEGVERIKSDFLDIDTIYQALYNLEGDIKSATENLDKIKEIFKDLLGVNDIDTLIIEKDGKYQYDDEAINSIIEESLTDHVSINNSQEEEIELEEHKKEMKDLLGNKHYLDEEFTDSITKMLDSNNQKTVQEAVNILWVLGEDTIGNSSIQFINIIQKYGPEHFEQEITPKIVQHQKFRIERILKRHNFYLENKQSEIKPYLENRDQNNQIYRLLHGNASPQEIK